VLAQAGDFQPVGEQLVPIAASSDHVVSESVTLTTLRRATGVVVRGCTVN
jgi:hypothetical protein